MVDGLGLELKYLKEYISSSCVAIGIVDKDRNVIEFSKGAEKLTGYKAEEIVGKKTNFFLGLNPEEMVKLRKKYMELGKIEGFETLVARKDGKEVPIAMTMFPLIKDKEVTAVVGIAVDISQKKLMEKKLMESEEKYRNLVDNANDIIYKSDIEGNVNFVNKKGLEILGFKDEMVLGQGWTNLVPRKDRKKGFVNEIIKKKIKSFELRNRVITKHGKIIYLDHSVSVIYDKKGNAVALEGVARDITEKVRTKKLEEKLNRIEEKKVPLTKKEKKGFYGLVKYPCLNDNQLARKIGLSRPTMTSIKNRLKKEGYYNLLNVPRLSSLGANIFSVFYADVKSKNDNINAEFFEEFPEIIFKVVAKNQLVISYVTKDFGNFQKVHATFLAKLNKHGIVLDNINIWHFPFNISTFVSFLDFAPILNRKFDLNIYEKPQKFISPKERKLTTKEKLVLYSLVKYPELNMLELSKKIGVARTTISLMKRRFINDGLLIPVVMPMFEKVGYELFVLSCMPFSAGKLKKEFNFDASNNLLAIQGQNEFLGIHTFENYTEFSEVKSKSCKFLHDKGVLENEPFYKIAPIKEIRIMDFDYASLLKRLLGI